MSPPTLETHRETGRVLRLEGPLAVVSVSKTGACEGCAARGGCHSLSGSDEREIRAVNAIGSLPGDSVELEIRTSEGLRAALWAYLVPTLVLVVAAVVAHRAAEAWLPAANTDLVAAFVALLAVGLLAMGAWLRRRAKGPDLRRYPTVLRKL